MQLGRDGSGASEVTGAPTRAVWARYIADEHAFWGKKLKMLKIELD
jgi:hypothetical protein